jgi:hypothetical protein
LNLKCPDCGGEYNEIFYRDGDRLNVKRFDTLKSSSLSSNGMMMEHGDDHSIDKVKMNEKISSHEERIREMESRMKDLNTFIIAMQKKEENTKSDSSYIYINSLSYIDCSSYPMLDVCIRKFSFSMNVAFSVQFLRSKALSPIIHSLIPDSDSILLAH